MEKFKKEIENEDEIDVRKIYLRNFKPHQPRVGKQYQAIIPECISIPKKNDNIEEKNKNNIDDKKEKDKKTQIISNKNDKIKNEIIGRKTNEKNNKFEDEYIPSKKKKINDEI